MTLIEFRLKFVESTIEQCFCESIVCREVSDNSEQWEVVLVDEKCDPPLQEITLFNNSFANKAQATEARNKLISILLKIFTNIDINSSPQDQTGAIKMKKAENQEDLDNIAFNESSTDEALIPFFLNCIEFDLDNAFQESVLCVNISKAEEADKLIPICADCCNAEELLFDQKPADACIDDSALKETCGEIPPSDISVTPELYIPGADPYSFWVSVVIPYWPQRFQNPNFRSLFEDTIRKEAPAHIGLRICWLDPKQMLQFEEHYRNWLQAYNGEANCHLSNAMHSLICTMFELTSVYPPAQLGPPGCNDPGQGNSVLLDFTQLG